MTQILTYGRERPELIELAGIDESEDWAVDYTELFYDPNVKEYVLITASGCSCWEGDYEEERFKHWKDLEASLIKDDRTYNPSLIGAKKLLEEGKEAYKKYKTTLLGVN